jgi:hypothetical protein
MSLNRIRYQQQHQQFSQLIKPGVSTVVTYGARDPVNGMRIVEAADGGRQIAQYLSNSTPNDVLALSQSSTIGLTGYISQKSH